MTDENVVTRAVRLVGGPTQVSWVCRVSAAAVFRWRKLGYVPDSKAAVLLSRATEAAGEPISVADLAGLPAGSAPTRPTGTDGPADALRSAAIGEASVHGGPAVDQAAAVLHLPVSTTAPRSPRTQKGARPRHSSSSR